MTINRFICNSQDFKDYVNQTTEYTYNANGAMTQDLNRGISSVTYNLLNLPGVIDVKSPVAEARNYYMYSSDGVKQSVVKTWNPNYSTSPVIGSAVNTSSMNQNETTDYIGNLVFVGGTLKRILTDNGFIKVDGNSYTYHYFIKDYLGSTRVVTSATATSASGFLQWMNYYPFGMTFADGLNINEQPYKYTGKEFDHGHGLNLYDFSARIQDPALAGRFMTMDPLAEKYYSWSPYVYCLNNPMNMIDLDGRDAVFIAFPDYKISTRIGKLGNLGHAGVLLIDNNTGLTKYYEYGRYDKQGKGVVRTRTISNVKIGDDGKPTAESLNKVLGEISEKAGQGGKIEGAYVESDKFEEMKNYAESKKAENKDSNRKGYSLMNNNCGTFAADVIKQDSEAKKEAPNIVDPRPNSMIKEYQKEFKSISFKPKTKKEEEEEK